MAIKFFGHFLLDEGNITKEQLISAVNYQESHNLSLGEIAVEEGLISKKEATKINDTQRTMDKRFGEVAIELKLLSDEEIVNLLSFQKKRKVFFGEALVKLDILNEDFVNSELKRYTELQNIGINKLQEEVENVDKNNIIQNSIDVFQTLYSRIIHDYIKLTHVHNHKDIKRNGIMAIQKMRGENESLDFALQPQNKVVLHIATTYLKVPFDSIDEDVEDILLEFVNVILGNIAVKLSAEEIRVDLTPPENVDLNNFNYSEYLCFDFSTTNGDLTLCLKI